MTMPTSPAPMSPAPTSPAPTSPAPTSPAATGATRPARRPLARRLPVTIALVLAGLAFLSGCGFTGLYSANLPGSVGGPFSGDHTFTITVYLADVLDLVPQSAVKVDDVTVGTVESIDVIPRCTALVAEGQACDVNDTTENPYLAKVVCKVLTSIDLPANSDAILEETSLLGEKFIQLVPPTAPATATGRLANNDVIGLTSGANGGSTSSDYPDIEDVFGVLSTVLNGGGLGNLEVINSELSAALAGREEQVRDALAQVNEFVGGLNQVRGSINGAIDDLDNLARSLNAQDATIADALDSLGPGLAVLANERANLVSLLQSLSNLGVISTKVVNASVANTKTDLQLLEPILTQLNAAGTALPASLELLADYPFPRNSAAAITGDDTSLNIHVNASSLCQNSSLTALCSALDLLPVKLPVFSPNAATSSYINTTTGGTVNSILSGAGS